MLRSESIISRFESLAIPGRPSLVKDENKQAYRFIEKALCKGLSLEAAPNAVHTGDAVRSVLLFAVTTQNTIEAAVVVLQDIGIDALSPDVVFSRISENRAARVV